MKRLVYLTVSVLVIIPVVIISCQCGTEGIEISLAPIHEVKITMSTSAERPGREVSVYIKGGLPDSCTIFHEATVERSNNTINVTVTIERPRDADCTQVYSFFEKNVSLGTKFTIGETYIINVNDKTIKLEISEQWQG